MNMDWFKVLDKFVIAKEGISGYGQAKLEIPGISKSDIQFHVNSSSAESNTVM